MKKIGLLLLYGFVLIGCQKKTDNTALGNIFVDTFYSFDHDKLQSLLWAAPQSQPEILYYQKWAECAHYTVMDRTKFFQKNDSTVIMPVTVKDDLMSALKIDFNVTDTFKITIKDQKIVSVTTASNDLPDYYEGKEWVKTNKPEYIEKQCEGIWEGGPTPCECVQGMIKGFAEYRSANPLVTLKSK